MIVDPRDIKLPAYIAVSLGLIAFILACIGIGTPSWQITYRDAPNNTSPSTTTNFYYVCYTSNSSCTSNTYTADSYIHLRQASGLAIVGILFLFAGTFGTLLVGLRSSDVTLSVKGSRRHDLHIFLGPLCLFIGTITMLAALSEGSQTIMYNGYSANLYQAAHVFAIFALVGSAHASGRRTLSVEVSPELLSSA
ncbi:unnamed protein product [Rotaria sordida]|uniref:Uncharacterized protein n=1 Tax=Rotaria sordida TaxID=392033 RepID=A0A814A0S2_9BILA|nr:unnamed protein product [Rotaria sordida]CAF0942326.1 unnamed protein product [Rotaria sordida]CAF0995057.1 unnamed protein product [Rotaria sordida]CAF1003530.1 unnamed protein product [Rotaria sordida]CAF1095257.1 unnamed protein product [Rotaria sordida]